MLPINSVLLTHPKFSSELPWHCLQHACESQMIVGLAPDHTCHMTHSVVGAYESCLLEVQTSEGQGP